VTPSHTWRGNELEGHVSSFSEPNDWDSFSRQEIPETVLNAYGLEPESIEIIGNVWKLVGQQGTYALKRTTLTEQGQHRLLTLNQMTRQGYLRTPTLVLTRRGDPFFQEGRSTYYLTQWINHSKEAERELTDQVWEVMADWHRLTTQKIKIETEWIETFTKRCLEVWSEQVLALDEFMNTCEHRHFPSPFEQRYMTFYHDLRAGADEAYRRMNDWKELLAEEKQIRLVLCHGKPCSDHLITSGHQRLWVSNEAAGMDLPIRDLTWYLRWGITQSEDPDRLHRGYHLYETTYPLAAHEKKLLSAQLRHPSRVISLIETYKRQRGKHSEFEPTVTIEAAYHSWGRTWEALSRELDRKIEKPFDSEETPSADQKEY
jgi:spore coat protein YsxE